MACGSSCQRIEPIGVAIAVVLCSAVQCHRLADPGEHDLGQQPPRFPDHLGRGVPGRSDDGEAVEPEGVAIAVVLCSAVQYHRLADPREHDLGQQPPRFPDHLGRGVPGRSDDGEAVEPERGKTGKPVDAVLRGSCHSEPFDEVLGQVRQVRSAAPPVTGDVVVLSDGLDHRRVPGIKEFVGRLPLRPGEAGVNRDDRLDELLSDVAVGMRGDRYVRAERDAVGGQAGRLTRLPGHLDAVAHAVGIGAHVEGDPFGQAGAHPMTAGPVAATSTGTFGTESASIHVNRANGPSSSTGSPER